MRKNMLFKWYKFCSTKVINKENKFAQILDLQTYPGRCYVYSLGDTEDSDSQCSENKHSSIKEYANPPNQVIEITEDSQELPDIASDSNDAFTFAGLGTDSNESIHSNDHELSKLKENKLETDSFKTKGANSQKVHSVEQERQKSPVREMCKKPCTNIPKDDFPKVGKPKSLSVQLVDIRVGIGSSTSVKLKDTSSSQDQCTDSSKTENENIDNEGDVKKDLEIGTINVSDSNNKVTNILDKGNIEETVEPMMTETKIISQASAKQSDNEVFIIDSECTTPNIDENDLKSKPVNIPNEKPASKMHSAESNPTSSGVGKTGAGNRFEISDEMIAEIDQEIAKSLQNAFGGLKAHGQPSKQKAKSTSLFNDWFKSTDLNIKPKGSRPNILRKPIGKAEKRLISDTEAQSMSDSEVSTRPVTKRRRTSQDEDLALPLGSNDPLSFKAKLDSMQKAVQAAINKLEGSAKSGATSFGQKMQAEDKWVKPASSEDKHEDEVVWICFVCAKSFPDQAQLMTHQDACEEDMEPSDSDVTPLKTADPQLTAQTSNPFLPGGNVIESDIDRVTPSNVRAKPAEVRRPSQDCVQSSQPKTQPVPTHLRKVGSSLKSLPLGLPVKSKMVQRRLKRPPDVYIPPSRDVYFESLGLFHTPTVRAISQSPRKSVTEDDCQIIDLTIDDAIPMAVPMTPRSRSLMSQLSRDDSVAGRRRQISFSQDTLHCSKSPQSPRKPVKKEPSESVSESSSEEEETVKAKIKTLPKSAILGIPLTSPLGQRLKKHWNFETKLPIITDYEQLCKTDPQQIKLEEKREKNPMAEKLRNRPPPQVTFRFTKKYMSKWFHKYKFSRVDKKEFEKTLRTGLERESRIRLKRMRPCKVVLQRIPKRDIDYWTAPKPRRIPRLPNSSSLHGVNRRSASSKPNILGHRQYASRQAPLAPRSALSQQLMIRSVQPGQSGDHLPYLQSPIPQLLVRTVPVEGQGMRLQVMPTNHGTMPLQNLYSRPVVQDPQSSLSHNQRRKQNFTGIKPDDMVICLSSDEEDTKESVPCDECTVSRVNCSVHGGRKIGPASFMKNQQVMRRLSEGGHSPVKQVSSLADRGQPMPQTVGQLLRVFNPTDRQNKPPVHGQSFITFNQSHITAPSVPKSASYFTNIRITDGKASVLSSEGTAAPSPIDLKIAESAVTDKVEEKDQNSAGSDSEYLNYEVICIESDEDL